MSAWYKLRSNLVYNTFRNLAGKRAHQAPTSTYNGSKPAEDINRFGRKFKQIGVFSGLAILVFCRPDYDLLITNYYTDKIHFNLVPTFMEKKLIGWKIEKIKEEFKEDVLSPDHPHTMRVSLIAKNMNKSPVLRLPSCCFPRQYAELEVVVIDRPIVQACCYGGKVFIFTGLLDHLESDDEIATVIGHEVGHDLARHTVVKITKIPWLACRDLFIRCLSYLSGGNLEDIKHPCLRKIEREADYIGGLLMASAGYDPSVAPTVYARLSKEMVLSDNCSLYPTGEKRAELISRPGVMDKLMCVYNKKNSAGMDRSVLNK